MREWAETRAAKLGIPVDQLQLHDVRQAARTDISDYPDDIWEIRAVAYDSILEALAHRIWQLYGPRYTGWPNQGRVVDWCYSTNGCYANQRSMVFATAQDILDLLIRMGIVPEVDAHSHS